MGHSYRAYCRKCRSSFAVKEGGGFFFHLLHCDTCGTERNIGFNEIGEPHLRYLKGLEGPYCGISSEHDQYVRENYPGEPMTMEEYHQAVEELCGKCNCGGRYRFEAPPRCPKCRREYLKTGREGIVVFYD
jgi:hypothetical protein